MKIACVNSKGGVGKSTLATHLAVWVHDLGFQTGLLDADKQRSSSEWIAEVEPGIMIRVANTHKNCLSSAQELAQSNDFVIFDAPGGLEDLSRTLLLLADLAIFPISPSILDVRSVVGATEVLRYAQDINGGRPEGILVLNKMKTRGKISRQLLEAAPGLGLRVAKNVIRDLQVFCDAPQQGTVVTRLRDKASRAAAELDALFTELLGQQITEMQKQRRQKVGNG